MRLPDDTAGVPLPGEASGLALPGDDAQLDSGVPLGTGAAGFPGDGSGGPAPTVTRTEGQVFAGGSLAARYASFVKLPHTLFLLPFAGVGAILASYTHPEGVTLRAVLWILVAFAAARFAAMGFNRIVDRRWDALNPRTAARELPTGRLSLAQAIGAVSIAALVFVVAAWQLNPLCGWLAPVALAWIFFYSFTKRFTHWAHNVLGFSLAIAPVGAYLAVAGHWSRPWYSLITLASAVMFWSAGFDIIYSLQDVEFDRAHGLYSLPARKGVKKALVLARVFHAHALVFFVVLGVLHRFPVHSFYMAGVAITTVILFYEHWMVTRHGAEHIDLPVVDRAFFHANVAVSSMFFVFTLLDRLLQT